MPTFASKIARQEARIARLLAEVGSVKASIKRYREQGYEVEYHDAESLRSLEDQLEAAYERLDWLKRQSPGSLVATRSR